MVPYQSVYPSTRHFIQLCMKGTLIKLSLFFVAVTAINLKAKMEAARTTRPGQSLYAGSLHDADGFEPAILGTKGQNATPRPPKPLMQACKQRKPTPQQTLQTLFISRYQSVSRRINYCFHRLVYICSWGSCIGG